MTDEEFLLAVDKEANRARELFPGDNAMYAALAEEVGEVAKALTYESWDALTKEAVQVAAMCLRLVTEGDATMREFRLRHVHNGDGSNCGVFENVMPGQTGLIYRIPAKRRERSLADGIDPGYS